VDAQRQQGNAWREVLTEANLKQSATPPGKKKAGTRHPASRGTAKKPSTNKVPEQAASKSAQRPGRKS
jgi:hypothetical protein